MDCRDCNDPLPSELLWALPESLLGFLWDDVFQRIIVFTWYVELHLSNPGDYPLRPAVRTALLAGYTGTSSAEDARIRENIKPPPYNIDDKVSGVDYLLLMFKAMRKDTALMSGNTVLNNRLNQLEAYFEFDDIRIPVHFVVADAFDYILSEKGIELFFPARPDISSEENFREHVFTLYEKRVVGKSAIALPPTMGVYSSSAISLPTIPSWKNVHKTVRTNPGDTNVEALMPQGVTTSMTTIASFLSMLAMSGSSGSSWFTGSPGTMGAMGSSVNPSLLLDVLLKALNKLLDNESLDEETKALLRKLAKCDFPEITISGQPPLQEGPVSYCVQIMILIESLKERCWFLSGSVFRRIAAEMPRLKARLWIDEIQSIPPVRKEAYLSDANDGCRKLFADRLEMSLPKCEEMYFRGGELTNNPLGGMTVNPLPPIPPIPQPSPIFPFPSFPLFPSSASKKYNPDEIYIHNKGISLPAVGKGPSQKDIYASWKNGAAANPTFTDSSNTGGCD